MDRTALPNERRLAGRPVGRVGFGAGQVGVSQDISINDAVRVIHAALDGGARLVDTADVYAHNGCWTGQSERLVGEALRRWNGDRSEVVVATKGGHVIHETQAALTQDASPATLRQSCERSLRALGVERIELYHLHSVDPKTPMERSLETLVELQREGKIHHIGLSNVGRGQIAQALKVTPIASVENRFSMLDQRSRAVLDYCAGHEILFLSYSPLGRGQAPVLGQRLPSLARIGDAHGVSPQAVALAWQTAVAPNLLPIPGADRIEHAAGNMAGARIGLSGEELAAIDADVRAAQASAA